MGDGLAVFASAQAVFGAIKKMWIQASSMTLNVNTKTGAGASGSFTGSITAVFVKHLTSYAETLKQRVPSSRGALLPEKEMHLAAVIATGHYCSTTAAGLFDLINQSQAVDSAAADECAADLDTADAADSLREAFTSAADSALIALCSAVFCRYDEVLQLISDAQWSSHASVGDESPWVTKFRASVKSVGLRLQNRMSAGNWSLFCDRIGVELHIRILERIMKIRRVTATAVQQLLLDTHGSSSVIEAMPLGAATNGGSSRSPADYVKMVRLHHAKTDGVLKSLLGDTEQQVIATAQQLVPELVKENRAKERNFFERLLEMKGLRPETPFDKVEQLREASAAIGQRLHDAATEAVRQGSLTNPLAGMISGDAVAEALNRLGRGR